MCTRFSWSRVQSVFSCAMNARAFTHKYIHQTDVERISADGRQTILTIRHQDAVIIMSLITFIYATDSNYATSLNHRSRNHSPFISFYISFNTFLFAKLILTTGDRKTKSKQMNQIGELSIC